MPRSSSGLFRPIFLITLVAGTLDILDALVFYSLRSHVAPRTLLQGIAGHLIGRSAYRGGLQTALLGLGIHFFIAAVWVTLFVVLARNLRLLTRFPVVCGALYGLLIYAVMNYLVLPLTPLYTAPSHSTVVLANAILALVLFMGVTVAVLTSKLAA